MRPRERSKSEDVREKKEMIDVFEKRTGRNFRRQRWQPWVCTKTVRKKEAEKEKRQVKDHHFNVQRGIFLHRWGLSKAPHHAWLLQANTVLVDYSVTHRLTSLNAHMNTHTLSEGRADCLLFLLFLGGQLCDTRRWHLSRETLLLWSWQITQLPFHVPLCASSLYFPVTVS